MSQKLTIKALTALDPPKTTILQRNNKKPIPVRVGFKRQRRIQDNKRQSQKHTEKRNKELMQGIERFKEQECKNPNNNLISILSWKSSLKQQELSQKISDLRKPKIQQMKELESGDDEEQDF